MSALPPLLALAILAALSHVSGADDAPNDHAGHAGHTDHADHADHAIHADHAGHADHAAAAGAAGAADAAPPHQDARPDRASLLGGHRHGHGGASAVEVSLGLLAATYDARLFLGDYQGAVLSAGWTRGRFGGAVRLPAYRLRKNGKVVTGIGDATVHGHATLVAAGPGSAGVMVMASAPSGDGDAGLGMGHAMLMGEAWGAWTPGRLELAGSAGYAHALGGAAAHAEHGGGAWPLVAPMNATELTYGATAMVALARALGVGLRAAGAAPIGGGDHRLIAGARVVWRAGRVSTAAEVLGGLIGDPFGLRGMIETSVRFP